METDTPEDSQNRGAAGRGRQTKLTPESAGRVLDVIQVGGTRTQAAERAGVNIATLERWLHRSGEPYAQFAEQVTRAESDARLLLVSTVTRCVMGGAVLSRETTIRPDGSRHVSETFSAPDGRLALEVLSRRYPREWGKVERIELNIQARAQALAEELGLSADSVIAEAQRIAVGGMAERRALGAGRP